MTTALSQKFAETQYQYNKITKPTLNYWLECTKVAALNFVSLIQTSLYDDDSIYDFGSRDGTAAATIQNATFIPVVCVDIVEDFVKLSEKAGLKSICARLEKLPLADASVDWGFCSHTLEHVESLEESVKELDRVVKRGLFLVFPLETPENAATNPSHMRGSMDPDFYIKPFEQLGWKRGWFEGPNHIRQDYQVFLYR